MSFVVKIRELPTPERKLMSKVISVCKLILGNPATSERSFSTAQRLKTLFRSTMTEERFTSLTILNSSKERTIKHTRSVVDLQTNFPTITITEGEVLVSLTLLTSLIYSKYQPLLQFFKWLIPFC